MVASSSERAIVYDRNVMLSVLGVLYNAMLSVLGVLCNVRLSVLGVLYNRCSLCWGPL